MSQYASGTREACVWLRFLKQIDRETPRELDLHLIVHNYATHKHPTVQRWLKAHPRRRSYFYVIRDMALG